MASFDAAHEGAVEVRDVHVADLEADVGDGMSVSANSLQACQSLSLARWSLKLLPVFFWKNAKMCSRSFRQVPPRPAASDLGEMLEQIGQRTLDDVQRGGIENRREIRRRQQFVFVGPGEKIDKVQEKTEPA